MKLSIGYAFLMVAFAAVAAAAPAIFHDPSSGVSLDHPSSSSGGSSFEISSPVSEPTATTAQAASATSIPGSSSDEHSSATSSVASGESTLSAPSSASSATTPSSSEPTSTSSAAAETSSSSVEASASSNDAPTSTATVTSFSATSVTSSSVEVTSSTESPATPTSSQTTSTDPTSSASSITSQPTSAPISVNKHVYLDAHNAVRAQFGASPLAWSDDLQAKAQGYAEQCQLKHSDGALGQVGENLAAATGIFSEQQAVALFTQDKDQFNRRDIVMSHFTQVVWKSTTQLGCGIALCPGLFGDRKGTATYHVCLYDPVGNVVGEEKNNLPID
ncbi:CAP domain-containing protein [Cerioporus squamosus]|nr:CAP domain-containing protein [Cerioporus squamosus]